MPSCKSRSWVIRTSSLRQELQLTACESGKHDGLEGTTCLIRIRPANLTSSSHSAIYQHGALHVLHAFYCSWCILCATRAMAQGATIAMTVRDSIELTLDRSSNKRCLRSSNSNPLAAAPWSSVQQYGVPFGVLVH